MSGIADKLNPVYFQKAYQDLSGPYPAFIIYPNHIEFESGFLWSGKTTLFMKEIANVEAVGNGITSFKRIVIKTADGHDFEVRTKNNENVREIILNLLPG